MPKFLLTEYLSQEILLESTSLFSEANLNIYLQLKTIHMRAILWFNWALFPIKSINESGDNKLFYNTTENPYLIKEKVL